MFGYICAKEKKSAVTLKFRRLFSDEWVEFIFEFPNRRSPLPKIGTAVDIKVIRQKPSEGGKIVFIGGSVSTKIPWLKRLKNNSQNSAGGSGKELEIAHSVLPPNKPFIKGGKREDHDEGS